MADSPDFALVAAAPQTARSAAVPVQFHETINRHRNNLIALSAALKAAGITPLAAAGYVDAALASFQNGLLAAAAVQEQTFCG